MPFAKATWTSGKQFVAESGSGHAVVMDTGVDFGGRNTGATPMELLLMGLAGCTGIDMVFILGERMKKNITGIEVEVNGKRAETTPKIYTDIEVTYRIEGEDLSEKEAVRAMRLSAEKYCSVAVMLGKTANFQWKYEVTDKTSNKIYRGEIEKIEH